MNDLPLHVIVPQEGNLAEDLLKHEWLVTNGLGGFASGSIASVPTWRYHGFLISAQLAPLGRMLMLKHVAEQIRFADGRVVRFSGEEKAPGQLDLPALKYLKEFRIECGIPVWRFNIDGLEFERYVVMPHGQNSVYLYFRITHMDKPAQLELRPFVDFRPHEAGYDSKAAGLPFALTISGNCYEISAGPDLPVLRLAVRDEHTSFTNESFVSHDFFFRMDAERGYDPRGAFWSPGYFCADLKNGKDAALVASTEPWTSVNALLPVDVLIYERQRRATLLSQASEKLREGVAADLVLAADQFLIEPAGRIQERVRARALGNSIRAVIAGYHWFTDWGRDTMISLEGLALATGRHREARWILHTLSRYVRDGLLPNLFPEGADDGLYHTADATLWYFHALDRYLDYTGDRATLRLLLPQLVDIAEHHVKGTRFGIGIDSADGLLRQGEQGYQLTWMDAKVDDWVVTPRRGKAVEINALWHNALRLLARWLDEERGPGSAGPWQDLADKQALSFNNRFWYDAGGYLFDIVDGEGGDDSSLRPNQILSFSLRYPVLDRARWQAVLSAVEEELLTPRGLRTLARSHPDYKASYSGDLRARDAAYHQGTVWPWLIGPFIDAWIACSPERRTQARKFLDGFKSHIEEGCIGSLSEICDSEPPYASRGCISQAWSVAEVLRCWLKTTE